MTRHKDFSLNMELELNNLVLVTVDRDSICPCRLGSRFGQADVKTHYKDKYEPESSVH